MLFLQLFRSLISKINIIKLNSLLFAFPLWLAQVPLRCKFYLQLLKLTDREIYRKASPLPSLRISSYPKYASCRAFIYTIFISRTVSHLKKRRKKKILAITEGKRKWQERGKTSKYQFVEAVERSNNRFHSIFHSGPEAQVPPFTD